jgi:hypothetical protein
MEEYHIRVFTHQLNKAKEDLRQHLREKGNLTGLDASDDDSRKYTAQYIDNDGEPQAAFYREVEVSDDNRLYIELSDGHSLSGRYYHQSHHGYLLSHSGRMR